MFRTQWSNSNREILQIEAVNTDIAFAASDGRWSLTMRVPRGDAVGLRNDLSKLLGMIETAEIRTEGAGGWGEGFDPQPEPKTEPEPDVTDGADEAYDEHREDRDNHRRGEL